MKTRKAIVVLFMLGCLTAFSVMAANAAWVMCTVDQVGPSGITEGTSGSVIYLTAVDASFTNKKCKISPNRGKEYLAAALTALASGKQVYVSLSLTAATPTINGIYVQK